jgi:hypothetical protein
VFLQWLFRRRVTRFQVKYESGHRAEIEVRDEDLRHGDHFARVLVSEKQQSGELPTGRIVMVKRIA